MTEQEELIEQVNNLQKCMSEQRAEHRQKMTDLKGSLYSANKRIEGFKFKIAELEKEQPIRDLKQQAKGVEDAIKETVSDLYRLPLRDVGDLYHYATVLRDQAKALKEKG